MSKKKRNQMKKQANAAAKHKQSRVQIIMYATLIALILVIVGVMVYSTVAKHQGSPEHAEFNYDQHPVMGNPDAPVKIVEFGDYKCPVCKRFDQEFLPKLKKDYIDTGKAAYYFINFPIIQGSNPAALAAESVYHRQPDLFWKYHEALYANQGDEDTDWANPQNLTKIGVVHVEGLNGDQLLKDIKSKKYKSAVAADRQKALDLGLNSTPSIFINGKPITELKYSTIQSAIDQAYESAK
ncbi:MAG TPA: thioredoxin domain-containing protein [Bacillales bacterium]|nr:thioredoxin domain-containing protein [Bacillales bacterium]